MATLRPLSSQHPCELAGDFNVDFIADFENASIVFQSGVESVYSLYQFQLFVLWYFIYTNGGKDIFYLSRNLSDAHPLL